MQLYPLRLYKQAYSGLSRETWLLSLVMLVNRSGTMVVPFMTIYLTEEMHRSIGEAALVMGLFGTGAIAGALLGGKLTDRLGFYRIQLFALGGGGVLFIILGLMNQFPLICVFAFLLSLVNESFRPANATAVAHYSEEATRTRSFSLNRLAINLGWAAGGALGGFIASHNYQLLFWVDGCTNIVAAFLLVMFLRTPRTQADRKPESVVIGGSPYRDLVYLIFILLTAVFAICFFQFFTTIPVYFKQELNLSLILIGILMSLNGLVIAFVEMLLVYLLEKRKSDSFYISIGVILVGLSFFLLNIFRHTPVFSAFAAMTVITFGEMVCMPFMNSFWVTRTNVLNRGAYASLYTIAFSLGQILGPLLGAEVIEGSGFTSLWWLIGLMSIATGSCFYFLRSRQTHVV